MGRPAYKITKQDQYIVYKYLERAMDRDELDGSLRPSLRRVEDTPEALQRWCDKHIRWEGIGQHEETDLWKKLKNAVLAARKRARDGYKNKKKSIDLDPRAWIALQRITEEYNGKTDREITYSDMIILMEDMYHRAVAKKIRPDEAVLIEKKKKKRGS